ncbi:MAG: SirB2 family protein, partial [Aeromonas sp.]
LHMTLALISVLLFIYRWSLALAGSERLQQKWLKILPHINDTLLLVLGVLLAVMLQMSPSQQPWLMAKLIALVLYIGLGTMALKRPLRSQKLITGIAALAMFGYMVGAAVTKSAWSWFF